MTDWKRIRAFHEAGLSFTVDWMYQFQPDFPVFAQLTREGMSMYLTEHTGDCEVGGAVPGKESHDTCGDRRRS